MKLIHYTKSLIESLEPREYNQSDFCFQSKPHGFWVSVEYAWKEWCESENFNLENLKISYEVFLKENANILHLKTSQEIFDFTKKYLLKTRNWDPEWDTYQLNWVEVKKIYQGIIISPYQSTCRLSLESCWYYGWDCSSGCIWDLSCIKDIEKNE